MFFIQKVWAEGAEGAWPSRSLQRGAGKADIRQIVGLDTAWSLPQQAVPGGRWPALTQGRGGRTVQAGAPGPRRGGPSRLCVVVPGTGRMGVGVAGGVQPEAGMRAEGFPQSASHACVGQEPRP